MADPTVQYATEADRAEIAFRSMILAPTPATEFYARILATLDAFAALTPCGYGVVDRTGRVTGGREWSKGGAQKVATRDNEQFPPSAPHRVVRLYAAPEETNDG